MKEFKILMMFSILWLMGCSNQPASKTASGDTIIGGFEQLKASIRYRFTDGNAELQKAFEAKKNAKTWKMRTEMRFHPGEPLITISEISCPNLQRMTGKVGKGEYELVRVGNTAYLKGPDGKWQTATGPADMVPCGAAVGYPAPWAMLNEGRDPATALAMISKANVPQITRGLLLNVNGVKCQEWQVAFGHPGSSNNKSGTMVYNVCLDYESHLPTRIAMNSGAMVMNYYDWNQPIQIEKPI